LRVDCLEPNIFETIQLLDKVKVNQIKIVLRPLLLQRAKQRGTWTLLRREDFKDIHDLYGENFKREYAKLENQGSKVKAFDWINKLFTIRNSEFEVHPEDQAEYDAMNK
jgi:hypothetical protein